MLFPEASAATFFTCLVLLIGSAAFDFNLNPLVARMAEFLRQTYILINDRLGDPEDKIARLMAFDLNAESWNMKNYQMKSIICFLQLYTVIFFGSITTATLVTGIAIVPFM